jgi:hypothetical protein
MFSRLNANLRDSTTADILLSNLDPKKNQIPLVVTETGKVVLKLSDCFEWRSDRQDERTKQAKLRGEALDPALVVRSKRPKKSRARRAPAESSSESDQDCLTTHSNKSKRGRGFKPVASGNSDVEAPINNSKRGRGNKPVSSGESESHAPITKSQRSGPERATRDDRDFGTTTIERPTKRVRPTQPAQGLARPRPQPIGQSSAAVVIAPASGSETIVRAEARSSQAAQAQAMHVSSSVTNLPRWARPWSGSHDGPLNPSRFGKSFDNVPKPRHFLPDRDLIARPRLDIEQAQAGPSQQRRGYNASTQRKPTYTARWEGDEDMRDEVGWDNGRGSDGDRYMHVEDSYYD